MASALLLATLLLSCVSLIVSTQSSAPCPLLGPDVPAPISLSTSSTIRLATSSLKKSLDAALQSSTAFGELDAQNTSFSVDFYSIHDTTSLFSYHHSAPGLAKTKQGVSTVDSDTIYRIGSVSKLITMYLYLIEAGDTSFNDPITRYVPELAAYAAKNEAEVAVDAIGVFDWDAITVGGLASHLAGVPRDAAPGPAQDQLIAKLTGLAPASAQNVSFCGDPSVVQIPCDRAGTG
jgi:CubicO group peptidase (beta-lactamase class C family)